MACGPDAGGGLGTDGESSETGDPGDDDADDSPMTGDDGTDGTADASDGSTGDDDDDSTGGDTGDPPEPIDWEPCPWYTGGTGTDAECVTFEVPLDWSQPDGEQIDYFVKRIGGGDGDVQVYMLMGGPGGSGVGYEDDAEVLLEQMPGLQIYLIDHRGTGRSSTLGSLDEAQATWGDGLAQFTTSNAARDLGWLIERTRQPGKPAHVYGASYGSYWAHRYLQLFPDQSDGVTMLGIAAPGFSFNNWTEDFNQVGLDFLSLCDTDPVCAVEFGPDAVNHAFQILVDVAQGQCAAAGLDVDTLRGYFASRVAWHWEDRALIPAILHRLERCNATDIAALQTAAPQIANAQSFSTEPPAWDATLGGHIRFSELHELPIPTDEQYQAVYNSAIFTLGSMIGTASTYDAWPRYEPDEYDGTFAETDTPILMLHGELDPNAPLEQALSMVDAFDGPNQNFYMIPAGVHAFPSPYPGGDSCMRQLFLDFMVDPTAELDDCTDDVLDFDFDQDQLAPTFFGTDSLWN